MEIFQQQTKLLETSEAKKIIKNFNKIAKVLLEFEVLYHRGWLRQVEAARSGLQASLLVRHPETNELYVNFDPQILTMIRETECMARLGLEIPPVAKTMRTKQSDYKEDYNALLVCMSTVPLSQCIFPVNLSMHSYKLDRDTLLSLCLSVLPSVHLFVDALTQKLLDLGKRKVYTSRAHGPSRCPIICGPYGSKVKVLQEFCLKTVSKL